MAATTAEAWDLERFVAAQDADDAYARALSELREERKRTHWVWFVFPQVAGIGRSEMARAYAISGLEEAKAYLAHPVLGPRLVECTRALVKAKASSASEILGDLDSAKLRSSMTLFQRAAPDEPLFAEVLARYFDGVADAGTDRRLA